MRLKSKLIMKQLKYFMLDWLAVFIFVFKCKDLLKKQQQQKTEWPITQFSNNT